jgi:hypothetical protein
MLFVGDEGLDGVTRLHALIASVMPKEWAELPPSDAAARVKIGIETGRGAWVTSLVAAGYEVFAINPMSTARYRERHSTSRAKSDLLTELWRGSGGSGRQVLVGASTVSGRGRRTGRGSGSVPVGGCFAWGACAHRGSV